MLLEGEDLTVAGGQVMVRTVEGPRPLSVLWRRLDSAFMDPARTQSRIAASARRAWSRRSATVRRPSVNALGSGILETRALLAFLPGICRECCTARICRCPTSPRGGAAQAAERDHVLANLDRMMIGPALSTSLPFDDRRHDAACRRLWTTRSGQG